ncbi:hypothetical protein BC943DRAFT_330495 [Umbelopsis sp. AD052]|nr:hypothetical protein BC943DRAFT_330495 [Umbelopsis sp. AD052]
MSRRTQGATTMLDAQSSRFSVNSNLMNYSIPYDDVETNLEPNIKPVQSEQREIQRGDSTTRIRQLENQIEAMTLQNVKLLRTNRLLKIDTDNLIKQTTQPLQEQISELTLANIRLQRANKLLQMDVDEKTNELNRHKEEEVIKLKSVGPEYEYLVQMINLLQRQINGSALCEETCCFTAASIDQSAVVMTLPPESDEQKVEAQHICRPVIHSYISQGSYAAELQNKIVELEDTIEDMNQDKEDIIRQLQYHTTDTETLKQELRLKEELVSQLEQEFTSLEELVAHLQQQLDTPDAASSTNTPPTKKATISTAAPVSILKQSRHDSKINRMEEDDNDEDRDQPDPRRRSQLLMASKRLSFRMNDTQLLEKMLRGDLSVGDEGRHHHVFDDDDSDDDDRNGNSEVSSSKQDIETVKKPEAIVTKEWPSQALKPGSKISKTQDKKLKVDSKIKDKGDDKEEVKALNIKEQGDTELPCLYPNPEKSAAPTIIMVGGQQAVFTVMSLFFGLAATLQITDDWTVPIALAVLASRFLWTGSMHGMQFKIKLP